MELDKKYSYLADLALLLVAIIWGLGFIAVKNGLDHIGPIYMLVLRFSLSAVIMSIIFSSKIKSIKKADVLAGMKIGFFLFFAFFTQTVGLKYTTVSNQAFITASNVVMVPFILYFVTKREISKKEFISAILCFIGIGIISLDGKLKLNLGDILTLVSAMCFAGHIILIGKYSKEHDPIILTILQFITAAILSIMLSFVLKVEYTYLNKSAIKAVLFLAIVSTVIAFLVQNIAQKYTSSTHAAIILSLEAVFGSLFSVILLSEKVTIRLILGCIIIFTAILIAELKVEDSEEYERSSFSEVID